MKVFMLFVCMWICDCVRIIVSIPTKLERKNSKLLFVFLVGYTHIPLRYMHRPQQPAHLIR